ncbi:MAG: efflux RND transporter permease subunit [Gemmatimonadetes bacterium]|nr:efflux RND transporter permease subunit [Gemmatimonadota bacterium]
MSIPAVAVRRPVAVAMLVLGVVLLGGMSLQRLPIDLLPDVSFPRLVIYTSYTNVAPSEVERLITGRVEAVAAAIPRVERVSSVSRDGLSLVTLRFAWGTDMEFATVNVREALDNLRDELPESAARPRILKVDPEAEPIMVVSIEGGRDLWGTKELVETVFKRRLEQLDGVAEAAVGGGLEREIRVEVSPRLVEAYDLTMEQIAAALARANFSAPGGTILRRRHRYPLRTLGEFQTVAEIGEVVVGTQRMRSTGSLAREGRATAGDGAMQADREPGFRLVRLSDVATIKDGFAEREAITRHNGRDALGLLVFKEAGANTVAVDRAVRRVLDELREQYPEAAVDVAASQATFVAEAIGNVEQALVLGGLLAFLVLFLFLRDPRYPVVVSLAIPISVFAALTLLEAVGASLNLMSLGGLALGVGMLVDNSIVVLESIFRHRELGVRSAPAAASGAEEVQGAITASTLTTIAVFVPVIYVRGVVGELCSDLSLAVSFSLLASLVVAITLVPTMAARWGRERADGATGAGIAPSPPRAVARWFAPALDAFQRRFDAFAAWYHGTLAWALEHRGRVVGMAGVALAVAAPLAVALERDLLPEVDQGAFRIRLDLPAATVLEATARAAARLEDALLTDPDVEAVFSRIGRDPRAVAWDEWETGLHTAILDARLKDGVATDDVLERVQGLADLYPAGTLAFETGQATALGRILGGADAEIAVRVRGEDLDAAFAYAESVRARLAALPALGNVRVAQERRQPQIQVEIDRERAAAYGIDPQEVAETIEAYMRGRRATEFVDFDRAIGVIVRLPDELRYSLETLHELRTRGVPLRELMRVRPGMGPAEIRREDQGRVVLVYADVESGGLGGAIRSVEAALAAAPPPRGLRADVGGENEEMHGLFRDLAFAFGLALALVYMILAAQFESFVHPFTILTAVPLALVGAVTALALTGQGFNSMSLIGIVILVGIVVNDAIVKVDFINQMREQGMSAREAILEAGRVRLRPILMTTVTTVLGLLPMGLGIGAGAELRAPLAIAVIGGLTAATGLTLVVVPVVYDLLESARRRIFSRP